MICAIRKITGTLLRRANRPVRTAFDNESGATAVEFSILFIPFMGLILSLFYVGMQHFAVSHFDMNVNVVMKQVYEGVPLCPGQPTTSPYTAACLAQRVCELPSVIGTSVASCKSTIKADFRKLNADGSDVIPSFFDGTNVASGALGTGSGGIPGDVVLFRAALPFPSWFKFMGYNNQSAPPGFLFAAQAFRVRQIGTYTNVRVN